MHCGFCLTTCPSYAVFEDEMDSPRGRILLMRVGHEEGEAISEAMTTHFDRCLGCMACVTACPSGVQYDRLIERVRPQVERHGDRTWRERALKAAIFGVFTHPGRLRALAPLHGAAGSPRPARRLGDAPPVPAPGPARSARDAIAPPSRGHSGGRRASAGTVAFMQGCVQRVLFGDVNAATVRVLAAEGFEVHAPRRPRCCGALQFHSGESRSPRAHAGRADRRGLRGL